MTLLALPEELLTGVVDKLVEIAEYQQITNNLRNLRLVCKRFDQNKCLKDQLFYSINLICDAKYYDRMPVASILNISSHVRHISFVPPLHSHLLDFRHFENLIHTANTKHLGCYVKAVPGDSPLSRAPSYLGSPYYTEYNTHLHTHWDIKNGYALYKDAAIANLQLMFGGDTRLQDAWTRLLSSLPRCASFRFGLVDYAHLDLDLQPLLPDCFSRCLGEEWNFTECDDDLATRMNDLFVPVATKILAESNAKIERLNFVPSVANKGKFWEKNTGWRSLNLSHLRSLSFESSCLKLLSSGSRSRDYAAINTLEDLLCEEEVQHSLEEFDCGKARLMTWTYPTRRFTLSQLKTLRLAGLASSGAILEWMRICPKLEKLVLNNLRLDRESHERFSVIADAVGNHANKPRLIMEGFYPFSFRKHLLRDGVDLSRVGWAALSARNAELWTAEARKEGRSTVKTLYGEALPFRGV